MLCKNCGANIEENSKFCGYCGSKVEVENILQSVVVNSNKSETNALNNEVDLGKTIRIEPIENDTNLNAAGVGVNNENNIQTPTTNQVVNQVQNNNVPQNNTNNKKSNKLLFVIGGVLLAIVAIVLVVTAFMKSSNNPVSVLEKAIYNLGVKGEDSLTIDAGLSFATTTGESFSFSLTVKTEMTGEESGNVQMTLNKSLFFDEMNIYSTVNKDEVTLYAESNVVDMLGFTSSLTPTWLYYRLPLDELAQEVEEVTGEEIRLQDLIDEEHFKYVDEANELRHYVLVVDQKLVDTLKEKLSNLEDEDIKDMLDSMETLEKAINIDFYINSLNELSKIEINMTEYLNEESQDISEFVLSMTFRDLNNTKVEIPSEALDSNLDLETYMSENIINNEMGLEEDNGLNGDTNLELNYDTNVSIPSIEQNVYGV